MSFFGSVELHAITSYSYSISIFISISDLIELVVLRMDQHGDWDQGKFRNSIDGRSANRNGIEVKGINLRDLVRNWRALVFDGY